MKAQALVTQNYGQTVGDTINRMMEECEMKTANAITTVNNWLSQGWVRKTPGKVLGALAVGGLIVTAALVTPSSAFADEPSRPLSATEPGTLLTLEDYFAAAVATAPTPLEPGALLTLEDILAGTSKLDWRLDTNGMDFVEGAGVGRTSNRVEASQGIGTIFNLAMDAILGAAPSGAPNQDTRLYNNGMAFVWDINPPQALKLDTRLYTNGLDFVEETGVGKGFYNESAVFGPLSDMIAAAELASASDRDYTIWADFPN